MTLFKIRNYLVHWNEIEFYIQGDSKDKLKISTQNKNLNKILSYYSEMDLIHLDKEKVLVSILTNKASDHFLLSMSKFAIQIYELIPENKRTQLTIDMFMFNELSEKYS